MSISKMALAVPLALGLACSTAGTQSSDHTGAMWPDNEHGDAATKAYLEGTGANSPEAATPQDGSASAAPQDGSASADTGSTPDAGSAVAMSGSSDQPGGTGSAGSSDAGPGSSDTTGSGSASDAAPGSTDEGAPSGTSGDTQQGATAAPGNAGAHEGDQHVHGKITKISKSEITIAQKGRHAKVLKLNPDTVVQVNGKDVKPSHLRRGQFVRASYENVSGDDVAVRIESGKVHHRHATRSSHTSHMNNGATGGSGTSESGSSAAPDAGAGGSSY